MINIYQVRPGDKIVFKGFVAHWFNNIKRNSEKLVIGQSYTVRYVEIASSWTLVKLEEFPETEIHGDDWFCLGTFEWPKDSPQAQPGYVFKDPSTEFLKNS